MMNKQCACVRTGYVIYRVRVRRGGRKRPVKKGATYGKPTNQGVNQLKFQRSLQSVAEVSCLAFSCTLFSCCWTCMSASWFQAHWQCLVFVGFGKCTCIFVISILMNMLVLHLLTFKNSIIQFDCLWPCPRVLPSFNEPITNSGRILTSSL